MSNFEHTTISYLLHSMTQSFYDYENGARSFREDIDGYTRDELLGKLLAWPPDLFAICSEILRRSGAYIDVAHQWPPYGWMEQVKRKNNVLESCSEVQESERDRNLRIEIEKELDLNSYSGVFDAKNEDHQSIINGDEFLAQWTARIRCFAKSWRDVLDQQCETLAEELCGNYHINGNYPRNGNSFPYETDAIGDRLRAHLEEKCSDTLVSFEANDELKVIKSMITRVLVEFGDLPVLYIGGGARVTDRIFKIKKKIAEYRTEQSSTEDPAKIEEIDQKIESRETMLAKYRAARKLSFSIIELALIADEVCAGMGFRDVPPGEGFSPEWNADLNNDDKVSSFLRAGHKLLALRSDNMRSASLLANIRASSAIVLPKGMTPNVGTSYRGLTHNLAMVRGGEVVPNWYNVHVKVNEQFRQSLTLLLFPYPRVVLPSQFQAIEPKTSVRRAYQKSIRYFGYRPHESEDGALENEVKRILNKAKKAVGNIDGVVFPEMAMTQTMHRKIRRMVLNEKLSCEDDARFLLAGVIEQSEFDRSMVRNKAVFSFDRQKHDVKNEFRCPEEKEQHKHHRWHLNSSQIRQYGVGAQLNPGCLWAEYMEIPRRHLQFFVLNERIVISSLVCEDLAQSDPIGDVIRAVGPNLVIALLADGPQLKHRWSAKCATGLADDPGSSVLTLTSLGFSNLSRSSQGKSRSRVVALWKDQITGTHEIEMPLEANAVVLSLCMDTRKKLTIDGRTPSISSVILSLAGIHFVT